MKIPHHGSGTAVHEPTWRHITASRLPPGIVTPFPARGGHLPREREIEWYRRRTSELLITAGRHPARRDPGDRLGRVRLADTPFTEFVRKPSDAFEALGQVRLRKAPSDDTFRVELFAPARSL